MWLKAGPRVADSGSRYSAKRLAAVLATAVTIAPQLACGAQASGDRTATNATCTLTRYRLTVQPATTTSNERHTLDFRATANACAHRVPVAGADVRLGSYRTTTDTSGRAHLTVRLQTGRYLIRLFVRGRAVARTHVWAIPIVSS